MEAIQEELRLKENEVITIPRTEEGFNSLNEKLEKMRTESINELA